MEHALELVPTEEAPKRKPKAVAEVKQPLGAVQSSPAAIFAMIERVAMNPDAPIERVEQLFRLYKDMEAFAAKKAFDADLAGLQGELPLVERKGKSHNGKYGRWEDIVETIQPLLTKWGFALSHRYQQGDKAVTVTTILSHKDGHREETTQTYPFDNSGNKNPIQAIGSAQSYGKRYNASALLNLATRDEDDDGKAAGLRSDHPITQEQADALVELADEVGADRKRMCAYYKVASLADLPASKLEEATKYLNKMRKG